ncbi:MAG: DNA polymerase III subunit delta' [Chitinophagaceae bacterium]|nr:MAG: DNA polymerase III subunit delta' [Chitinophagaceae bacterium]
MFRDVIGQGEVKQHLVEMVAQNRLSHALLFLGKEGGGALPLALAFAQYVSLLPTKDADPGGGLFGEPVEVKLPATPEAADEWMEKQPSFAKTQGMVHPDIHYAYPVIKRTTRSDEKPVSTDWITEWRDFMKQFPYGNVYDWLQFMGAENKQGNITAHECNEIIRKLNLKSFESGYKILVLWMPEYLGKEGNKLLKLIEEPPADTLFILVAENESAILNTILSRCQLVKVPALEAPEIDAALRTRAGVAPAQAKQLANAADGSYREALHMLQHADEDFTALLKDWLGATIRYIPAAQLKVIEEMARLGREKQKQLLRYFTHLIEQALRLEVQEGAPREALLQTFSDAEADFAERLNKIMDLSQKEAVATELDAAAYHIERNANAKILFHALTIKFFYILKHRAVISV